MISTGFQIFTSTQPNNAFVSLQGKTLFIWQIKVAKTAKAKLCATNQSSVPHPKLCATNQSSVPHPKLCGTNQSSVPQPKLCATKHGIGGPGVLWHIKIRYLPNAVSQSLRIQLALNSLIRTPVSLAEKHSKAKTGKLSPEFGFAEFLSFVSLQGKTLFIWQIKVAKMAKAKLCATENKFPPNSWVFKPNFSYFQK